MVDPVSTIATCFALILTPNGTGTTTVIQNYPTRQAAENAGIDALSNTTAKQREEQAEANKRYLASEEYAAKEKRQQEEDTKQFVCENWKKSNDHVQCYAPPFSVVSVMATGGVGVLMPFSKYNVIDMPCITPRKEN